MSEWMGNEEAIRMMQTAEEGVGVFTVGGDTGRDEAAIAVVVLRKDGARPVVLCFGEEAFRKLLGDWQVDLERSIERARRGG